MHKRAAFWRLIAAVAIVAASILLSYSSSPKLGLDLKGGTQIVLETKDGDRVKANRASTERALEIIRGRVDALGVAEPTLTRSGDRRIIVELPGVQDPREAVDLIGQTAQLPSTRCSGSPPRRRPRASSNSCCPTRSVSHWCSRHRCSAGST